MKQGFLFLLVLLLLPSGATAAVMYQVNNGATVTINEHGVCQHITNNHASGQNIMVPTRTATEWTTFRNNRPPGVTAAPCPTRCQRPATASWIGCQVLAPWSIDNAPDYVDLTESGNYTGYDFGPQCGACSPQITMFWNGDLGPGCRCYYAACQNAQPGEWDWGAEGTCVP